MYNTDAIKIPLQKLNFFNKLNKKKNGRFKKTQFRMNVGKIESCFTLDINAFQSYPKCLNLNRYNITNITIGMIKPAIKPTNVVSILSKIDLFSV